MRLKMVVRSAGADRNWFDLDAAAVFVCEDLYQNMNSNKNSKPEC